MGALTRSEAQLTLALLAGTRLANYAEQRSISLNTTKSHLKGVFDKSGHKRQSDLLRDLLADPLLRLADDGEGK